MKAAWASLERWEKRWILCWCAWLVLPAVIGYVVLTKQQGRWLALSRFQVTRALDCGK